MAERLDIVHDRGTHVETEHRREIGRLYPWITALAFERFNQAGFFSANVSARAAMNINLRVKPCAEDILSQKVVFSRFFNGTFEDLRTFGKFASDIDVGRASVERETRDQNPFEQLVWIFVDNVAVLERARLRFIRVADQIDRPFLVRLDETPLHAAWKTGAPTSAEAGGFDFIDNLGTRHCDRLAQLFVTAVAQVGIDVDLPIVASDVFEDQPVLERVGRSQSRIADCGLRI